MNPLESRGVRRHVPVIHLRVPRGHTCVADEVRPCGNLDDSRRATWFQALAGISVVDVGLESGCTPELRHQLLEAIAPWFHGILVGPRPESLELGADETLGVPVFSQAADGTAVVACAAALRGLLVARKAFADAQFVITGTAPASIASAELLCALGIDNSQIVLVDRDGVIHASRRPLEGPARSFALKTSRRTLQDAVAGADVFVGLSRTGALTPDLLCRMAPRPVVVALAVRHLGEWGLTTPLRAGVLHASGDNQCIHQATDLLVLPAMMRGTIDVDAAFVDDAMRVAAVQALLALAPGAQGRQRSAHPARCPVPLLLPSLVDPRLVPAVASAVAAAALATGAARRRATFDVKAYAAALRRSMTAGDTPRSGMIC